MILLPLLYFYFLQVPNVAGLFEFVFGRQKLCFCRCGIQRPAIEYLLGGDVVSPYQFPWLAIVNAGSMSFSGALVSDRHIVTAASPLYGIPSNNITVILGARDRCGLGEDPSLGETVETVNIHPSYSPTTSENDIALVKLRHPVSFDNLISPICLPLFGSQRPGHVSTVASWSDFSGNSSCVPKVSSLPILPPETCITSSINSSMVTADKGCLGPVGTTGVVCKDDVGAPVMTQWIPGSAYRLVGVVSAASCHQESTPLFTMVIDHTYWIHKHIFSDCQCF